MGLNETPLANRTHIGIFGRRNVGKSSLMNAVTGQNLAIVSEIKGTTTDPVSKAMELLPLGPVVMIDTPGLDDEGDLGKKRVEKSMRALDKTDIAVLVSDGRMGEEERKTLLRFAEKEVPYVIAINKSEDFTDQEKADIAASYGKEESLIFVSAKTGSHIQELKERIAASRPPKEDGRKLVGDLLDSGDIVVLVVPIDSAAPKGRLILPQQQVIRDCLEAGAIPVITGEKELPEAFRSLLKKPKAVITDSQAFQRAADNTPEDIFLTSFSILFSRYKGDLEQQVLGAKAIRTLKDGDCVLICEGCTHHRQCEDIGTVKMPRWIREFTGKDVCFRFCSGTEFPEDLSEYAAVIHCGGCTLNEREMKFRLKRAKEQGVPMTNYGVAIADMHGILDRSLEMFRGRVYERTG